MNRDCNGDFYEVGRVRWYRCFMDGHAVKASTVGATCPRCQRVVDGQDRGRVELRTISTRYVKLGDLGWVPHADPTK